MAYTYGSVTNCKVANGQTRSEYECRLGYQVNSQDITNNTSNVTLRLEVRSISSTYKTYGINQTTTIDGTALSAASFDMRSTNTWQLFGSRTITISHNADGTYSASKSGSFTTTASSGYSLKSGSASVTVSPATIARATTPTVSSSSVNMGSSVTISTPRASSNFTHTLLYTFGNSSAQIAANVATSFTWTPPLSLANQVPNGTSGTCTITCYTYNGSTHIGTKSINITLNVPSSIVPSISSVTVSEGGSAVPSSWGVYVKNYSRLKVITSASGSYSSTITSYKITGIDGNTYNSSNFTSNALISEGSKTITITVTDSRGRTASTTRTYTCVDYSSPVISSATVARCLSDGTASEEGTYLKYTFKASVSPVSNKNTYAYKIRYKTTSSSSYTDVNISNSSYSLDKTDVVLSEVTFSADNAYDIQFYVGDYFTSSKQDRTLSTAFVLINFNASGKALAFGKVSEAGSNEKKLEVAMPLHVDSNITLGYNTNGEKNVFFPGNGGTYPHNTYLCGGNTASTTAFGIYDGRNGGVMDYNDVYRFMEFFVPIWGNSAFNRGSWNVPTRGLITQVTDNSGGQHSVIVGLKSDGSTRLYGLDLYDSDSSPAIRLYCGSSYLGLNSSGVSHDGTYLQQKPISLYDNSSGTTGTVTLSETSANFTYLEIFYKNGDGYSDSIKVYSPNGKNLAMISNYDNETYTWIKTGLISISGTSITRIRTGAARIGDSVSTAHSSDNLNIIKVIGIK